MEVVVDLNLLRDVVHDDQVRIARLRKEKKLLLLAETPGIGLFLEDEVALSFEGVKFEGTQPLDYQMLVGLLQEKHGGNLEVRHIFEPE